MDKPIVPVRTEGPPPTDSVAFTSKQLRDFIRKYRLLILVVFVTTTASAYATLSLLTELYDVNAALLIKLGRENLDPPATSRNVPLSTGLRPQELLSEIEILKSPDLIAKVVDEMGPAAFEVRREPPSTFVARIKYEIKSVARGVKDRWKELLIVLDLKKRLDSRRTVMSELAANLSVEPRKDSDVIGIGLRTADPVLGERVVVKLIELYLVRRIEIRETLGVKEFLDERTRERYKILMSAQSAEISWKQQKDIASAEEQKSILLRQIESVSSQAAATLREIQSLERQSIEAKHSLKSTPKYLRSSEEETPNPQVQMLKERIANLQVQRITLLSKYQPESDPVRNLNREIADLQELLSKEETIQVARVTSQLNAGWQSLGQRVRDISIRLEGARVELHLEKRQLQQLRVQVTRLDASSYQLSSLQRERQIAEQDYLSIIHKDRDADVAMQLDRNRISNVSLLTTPTTSLEPVYPRKLLIMLVSLIAGLLFGVGLSLLMQSMDKTLEDGRDVESDRSGPPLEEVNLISTAGEA